MSTVLPVARRFSISVRIICAFGIVILGLEGSGVARVGPLLLQQAVHNTTCCLPTKRFAARKPCGCR